jgi:hypothetical protein
MEYLRKRDVEFRGRHAVLYWMRRGPGGEEELRLTEPDGTLIADDLMPVPDDLDPEDWFNSLRPELMPVWIAENGVTEKRMIVRMREVEERLTRLEALMLAAPEKIEIPEFLKGDEPIPAELADLFDPADTAPQSNEKLLVRLREVLGLIGLAEDAGGRAAPELYRRKDRLESGIRWNRGRSAEAI